MNIWIYWVLRLLLHFSKMLMICIIGFPIAIYLVIPVILWIFADTPYTWPTNDYLLRWVRYGLACTLWVGCVVWLSEFLPWLIRVIRSRRHNDTM